jgi:hypothetical protein
MDNINQSPLSFHYKKSNTRGFLPIAFRHSRNQDAGFPVSRFHLQAIWRSFSSFEFSATFLHGVCFSQENRKHRNLELPEASALKQAGRQDPSFTGK